MIYLSGVVRPSLLGRPDVGVLLTPNMGNRPNLARTPFALDTGCFSQGEQFRLDRYLAWLETWRAWQDNCLFATAPDVVGDAEATWRRSKDVLPALRDLGYPAALVAQDGMEEMDVAWNAFDCLFIGGTTAWKVGEAAYQLGQKTRGTRKHLHMGRVNTARRLRAAAVMGCDSVDGTLLAFGPDVNWVKLSRWLVQVNAQAVLYEWKGGMHEHNEI